MRFQLSSILLTAVVGSAGPSASPAAPASTEALDRVLDAATARVQRRLTEGLELYRDHSSWSSPWEVRSANYLVRTTHSRYLAADLAEGLETMHALFRETLLTSPGRGPRSLARIDVLPTLADYTQFGNQHGAEHSSFYGSFYATAAPDRPIATYAVPNRDLLRMWVTHGAFHHFVETTYERPLPFPLAEGLASYFASWWRFEWSIDELERLRDGGRLIPLRTLLATPIQSWLDDRAHDRLIELGMLVAYLLHYHPETRTVKSGGEVWQAPFSEYLDALLTGDDATLSPVHDLLDERLPELERDFFAFEFPRRG